MVLVVKIGGSVLDKGISDEFISDLRSVLSSEKVILVHGGAKEVTRIAEKLGKRQQFVVSPEGFRSRYTDEETARIFAMVMVGKINNDIVNAALRGGIPAFGISGLDGGLIRAERKKRLIIVDERGRKRVIEGGYTGKITSVNVEILNSLLEKGYLPVIAPIALGTENELLTTDADRSAAYIAGAMKAEKLILLTDVPGLYVEGEVVQELKKTDTESLLPKIGTGMKMKVYAAIEALNMGVKEVIISSALVPRPISSTLNRELGTVIHE